MNTDDDKAMRKLAAAVLSAAVKDFRNQRLPRETRNEAAKFLTRETIWHWILGLRPDTAARWLRTQIEGKRV